MNEEVINYLAGCIRAIEFVVTDLLQDHELSALEEYLAVLEVTLAQKSGQSAAQQQAAIASLNRMLGHS